MEFNKAEKITADTSKEQAEEKLQTPEDFMKKIKDDLQLSEESARATLKRGEEIGLSQGELKRIEKETNVKNNLKTIQNAVRSLAEITERKLRAVDGLGE